MEESQWNHAGTWRNPVESCRNMEESMGEKHVRKGEVHGRKHVRKGGIPTGTGVNMEEPEQEQV